MEVFATECEMRWAVDLLNRSVVPGAARADWVVAGTNSCNLPLYQSPQTIRV